MSEEEFDKVIEVNLKGAFNCMKHVSRIMLKQKSGHIINMSSVSGVMGNAGQVNYCASKAGIIGMTKSLARELGSRDDRRTARRCQREFISKYSVKENGTDKRYCRNSCFLSI